MGHELTIEEIRQLDMLMDTLRVDTHLEEPVWRSKPLLRKTEQELPLEHEAASESFLVAELEGRVKLSNETRLMEEVRLRQRSRKRKPYSRKAKGRYHHQSKAATKRRYYKKLWEENPLERIRYTFRRTGVDIRAEEWQRLVEPVWNTHEVGGLKIKNRGGKTLHVYNMELVDKEGKVVYSGPNQAVRDVQNPEWMLRVLELQA